MASVTSSSQTPHYSFCRKTTKAHLLCCSLAKNFAFLLRFQPEQQTAFAAFLTVSLLGFEQSRFFEVTDSAADGGGRELEVGRYSRDGRPAFSVFIHSIDKVDIHRHGAVRQLGAVKKIKTAQWFAPPFLLSLL